MAHHKVGHRKGKHKGNKEHKGLKVVGGFKSMEHKKSRRKRG